MSNDCGSSIWVSDLDAYIDIDAISAANEREAEEAALELELDEIGEIPLLAGKATSAWQLHHKEITLPDWRHAIHQAKIAVGSDPESALSHSLDVQDSTEGRFIRTMLDLGRSYAVARYARWERLDYPSAITATLPYGIRALVNQFIAAEGIPRSSDTDERIRSALGAGEVRGMTAYRRTGTLQAVLHAIADEAPSHPGGAALDRDRTRTILALIRLYFSTLELRLSSLQELRCLMSAYVTDRDMLGATQHRLTSNGRSIRGWCLRHIRSLLDLYPYSIRYGLMRATISRELTREAIVNELALAHCSILRMRRAGRNRTLSR